MKSFQRDREIRSPVSEGDFHELSRMTAEMSGPGRWPGVAVVVLALLLIGWFGLDLATAQEPTPYLAVVGVSLLACLAAIVATMVALVGLWPTAFLWVAAAGFGGAAVLNLLGEVSWMAGAAWDEAPWRLLLIAPTTYAALMSLALALVCVWLARSARWRRLL